MRFSKVKRSFTHSFLVSALLLGLLLLGGCRSKNEEPTLGAGRPSIEPLMPEPVRRIFIRSCQSCHGPNGQGIAGVAPDLRRIRSRSIAEWDRFLRESARVHPVSAPAPLWLTADEMKTMSAYLGATCLGPGCLAEPSVPGDSN